VNNLFYFEAYKEKKRMEQLQLGDLLFNIHKNLKTKIERELKEYDIGMGQLYILMVFFSDSDRSLTQNDLVKAIGVDKGNISRGVEKLVDKGYLAQRKENKKLYYITERGVMLKVDVVTKFININGVMTQDITPVDIEQLVKTLNTISKNLEKSI
jgi:DNA-binding MarR family transcriptional regulator